MEINKILELILTTYNRKRHLEETLKQLLSQQSPVRTCCLTILDNASDDGSCELISQYAAKYPNIKHIRHNRNIGGNANIARAFEIASFKYFWVLADDDDYNWSAWNDIENAMCNNFDLIIVNNQILKDKISPSRLPRLLTFCPSAIHKSTNLDTATIINVYDNVPNWFPHLAPAIKVINNNGKIFVTKKSIVISGQNDNNKGIFWNHRMKGLSPSQTNRFFEVGFLNSLEMILDTRKRSEAVENYALSTSFFKSIVNNFKKNRIEFDNYKRNLSDPWNVLNFSQKIRYILALITLDILFVLKYMRYRKRRIEYKKKIKKLSEKDSL